jgi:hypothetical protein
VYHTGVSEIRTLLMSEVSTDPDTRAKLGGGCVAIILGKDVAWRGGMQHDKLATGDGTFGASLEATQGGGMF